MSIISKPVFHTRTMKVQMHRLVSAFVVQRLDTSSRIYLVYVSKISSLMLVSVTAQADLCLIRWNPIRQVFPQQRSYCHLI